MIADSVKTATEKHIERLYQFASNQIFNDVNITLMSDDLIRSLIFGK